MDVDEDNDGPLVCLTDIEDCAHEEHTRDMDGVTDDYKSGLNFYKQLIKKIEFIKFAQINGQVQK